MYTERMTFFAAQIYAHETKAYDSHCNLVLGDAEETIYIVEDDDEDEEIVKVKLTACQPLKDVKLMRCCRLSRSSQKCSLSGVSHPMSALSNVVSGENRGLGSAHFAASPKLRKTHTAWIGQK